MRNLKYNKKKKAYTKKMKDILTKRILKRIRRRAKVKRFNKHIKNNAETDLIKYYIQSVERNKAREASYNAFNQNQYEHKMNSERTQNMDVMLNNLTDEMGKYKVPPEVQKNFELYRNAIKNGHASAADASKYLGPVEQAVIQSVPYENVNDFVTKLRDNVTYKHSPDYINVRVVDNDGRPPARGWFG